MTDSMRDAIAVENALFSHHAREVQHHRDKIRYLVSLLLGASTAILVYQRPHFFDPTQFEWPILIGAFLLLTSIYYALTHHCIKLLTKCMHRDHHESMLRNLRTRVLHELDPQLSAKTPYHHNISVISGPFAILLVAGMAWLSIIVFIQRLENVSCYYAHIDAIKAQLNTIDDIRAQSTNEALANALINRLDSAPLKDELPKAIAEIQSKVRNAERTSMAIKISWGIITIFAFIEISWRFIAYIMTNVSLVESMRPQK
jgi:hypothetical protein